MNDESSDRTGQRLVIVLKRDAVAKVVLNNLYKHTQLQDSFGANMLAHGRRRAAHAAPGPVRHATRSSTRSRSSSGAPGSGCARPQERAHILRALLKALDAIDEVIALIRAQRRRPRRRAAGLMALLEIDEIQANAILDMQLRRLAALERQRIIDEHDELDGRDRRLRGDPGLARSGSGRSSATS